MYQEENRWLMSGTNSLQEPWTALFPLRGV